MQRFQIISTPKVQPTPVKPEVKVDLSSQGEDPDLEPVVLQRQIAFVKSVPSGLGTFMKKGSAGSAMSLPPPLQTTASVRHIFRFESSSAITTAFGITGAMLSGAFGGICSVFNSTLCCWTSTAKIHRIRIWPGLSSSSAVPGVLWSGVVAAISKDYSLIQSMPGGVSIEGCLVSKPPKDSLCETWINLPTLGNSALFSLENIPAQSIVDVAVTFQLRNNLGGYNLGITTGAVGNVYYAALDGPAVHKLVPVGLPTTN